MSSASIKSLLEQIESGQLRTDRAIILNYIKKNTEKKKPTTVLDLRNRLMIPHQTMTARLTGLEDLGVIYKDGEIKVRDTNYCCFYFEPCTLKRFENIKKIRTEKFEKWIKKANEFEDLIGRNKMNLLKKLLK